MLLSSHTSGVISVSAVISNPIYCDAVTAFPALVLVAKNTNEGTSKIFSYILSTI